MKSNVPEAQNQIKESRTFFCVQGRPVGFQLVPLSEDDDLIDSLLEHNPKFRQTLRSRLKEKTVSIKEARRQLK